MKKEVCMKHELFPSSDNGVHAMWAFHEAKRLEDAAREFGFSPQKTEYRISHPIGDEKDRLQYFSNRPNFQ